MDCYSKDILADVGWLPSWWLIIVGFLLTINTPTSVRSASALFVVKWTTTIAPTWYGVLEAETVNLSSQQNAESCCEKNQEVCGIRLSCRQLSRPLLCVVCVGRSLKNPFPPSPAIWLAKKRSWEMFAPPNSGQLSRRKKWRKKVTQSSVLTASSVSTQRLITSIQQLDDLLGSVFG